LIEMEAIAWNKSCDHFGFLKCELKGDNLSIYMLIALKFILKLFKDVFFFQLNFFFF
jgi:hypothetical protein